jgi:large subunit ribosomal protein L24
MALKIKKGDTVRVIAGANKGKVGKVLAIDTKNLRITVEGVNLRKKHIRPSQKNPQGGIETKEAPIHYSNVMLVDSKGKPTRVSIKRVREKDGKIAVTRIAKTTKQEIPFPTTKK